MGIRIWWQNIFPEEEQLVRETGLKLAVPVAGAVDRLMDSLRTAARPDTRIDFRYLTRSAYMVQSYYLETLNTAWLLDGVIEAEKQGYDAVIIGCANDPGLQQARQAVDIPVVAPVESASLLACTLGSRFGIVTVLDELVAYNERNIRLYGLESRLAPPIRVFPMGDNWVNMLFEMLVRPQVLEPEFDKVCRQCVEAGAEIIIPACCALSPAATLLGYREVPGTGVPVLDVTHAAVKMAETLVDLRRNCGIGKSQKRTYRSVPPELRDAMRALAGFAVPAVPPRP